uniref:Sugar transporter SWEET1 n=1 Tax=Globodera rostochiensis TaxID=31243 RepID=A0A914I152_GLORO
MMMKIIMIKEQRAVVDKQGIRRSVVVPPPHNRHRHSSCATPTHPSGCGPCTSPAPQHLFVCRSHHAKY